MRDLEAACLREISDPKGKEKLAQERSEKNRQKLAKEQQKMYAISSAIQNGLKDMIASNERIGEFKLRAEAGFGYTYRIIHDFKHDMTIDLKECSYEVKALVEKLESEGHTVKVLSVNLGHYESLDVLFIIWGVFPEFDKHSNELEQNSRYDFYIYKDMSREDADFFLGRNSEKEIENERLLRKVINEVYSDVWVPSSSDRCFGEGTKIRQRKPSCARTIKDVHFGLGWILLIIFGGIFLLKCCTA